VLCVFWVGSVDNKIDKFQQEIMFTNTVLQEDCTVNNYLSKKPIPVRERLIFPLDVPTHREAIALVDELGDSIRFYKLGLQIFMAQGNYNTLIDQLSERAKKVFVDLKFYDIPETVGSAVRQMRNNKVEFLTVHGADENFRAAVKEKNGIKILAVTVLTSLDKTDLVDLGFDCEVEALVLSRARRAIALGCDGVISSGMEASKLRENLGDKFLIISPGIRPLENKLVVDDQKRIMTVEEAFHNGADYIVVGRPIRTAPNPKAKAEEIQRRIEGIFQQSRKNGS